MATSKQHAVCSEPPPNSGSTSFKEADEEQQSRQSLADSKMKEDPSSATSMLPSIRRSSGSDPSAESSASTIAQTHTDLAQEDVDASREGAESVAHRSSGKGHPLVSPSGLSSSSTPCTDQQDPSAAPKSKNSVPSTRDDGAKPSANASGASISKPSTVPRISPTAVQAPIETGKIQNTKQQQHAGYGRAQYGCLECGTLYEHWKACRGHMLNCCPDRLRPSATSPFTPSTEEDTATTDTVLGIATTTKQQAKDGQAKYGCIDCGALYEKWMPCRGHMLSCCPGRLEEGSHLELVGRCSIGASKCQVPSHVSVDGTAVTVKSLGSSDSDPGPSRWEGQWLKYCPDYPDRIRRTMTPSVAPSEDDTATMATSRSIATTTKESAECEQATYGCLECDSLYEKWMPCRGHMLSCCPDRLDEVSNLELVGLCLISGAKSQVLADASTEGTAVCSEEAPPNSSDSSSMQAHEKRQDHLEGSNMKVDPINAPSTFQSSGPSTDPSAKPSASPIVSTYADKVREDVIASTEGTESAADGNGSDLPSVSSNGLTSSTPSKDQQEPSGAPASPTSFPLNGTSAEPSLSSSSLPSSMPKKDQQDPPASPTPPNSVPSNGTSAEPSVNPSEAPTSKLSKTPSISSSPEPSTASSALPSTRPSVTPPFTPSEDSATVPSTSELSAATAKENCKDRNATNTRKENNSLASMRTEIAVINSRDSNKQAAEEAKADARAAAAAGRACIPRAQELAAKIKEQELSGTAKSVLAITQEALDLACFGGPALSQLLQPDSFGATKWDGRCDVVNLYADVVSSAAWANWSLGQNEAALDVATKGYAIMMGGCGLDEYEYRRALVGFTFPAVHALIALQRFQDAEQKLRCELIEHIERERRLKGSVLGEELLQAYSLLKTLKVQCSPVTTSESKQRFFMEGWWVLDASPDEEAGKAVPEYQSGYGRIELKIPPCSSCLGSDAHK